MQITHPGIFVYPHLHCFLLVSLFCAPHSSWLPLPAPSSLCLLLGFRIVHQLCQKCHFPECLPCISGRSLAETGFFLSQSLSLLRGTDVLACYHSEHGKGWECFRINFVAISANQGVWYLVFYVVVTMRH